MQAHGHGHGDDGIGRAARELEQARRNGAITSIVLAVLFACFALACFVGGLVAIVEGAGFAIPVLVFGLFWAGLTLLLGWIGGRTLARSNRTRRLRARGLRGLGTVLAFVPTNLRIDAATKYSLTLRVSIEGRPTYELTYDELVDRTAAVSEGAQLPVLVDPQNANDVMVDWWAPTPRQRALYDAI